MQSLRQQHETDLRVYRESHRDIRNRALHWFLVPIETVCFFGILLWVSPPSAAAVAGSVLGLYNLWLSPDGMGRIVCFFHASIGVLPRFQLSEYAVAWCVSWFLQVYVGHRLWEGNTPNIGRNASTLSMLTSVLIAWKS